MIRRVLLRAVEGGMTLLVLLVLIFVLIRLLPGDPAIAFAGEQSTAEDLQRIRETMGLDQPMPVQLVLFFGRLAVGDLGKSVRSHLPVWDEIASRVGRTVLLGSLSLALGLLAGVGLAILASRYPGSLADNLISVLAVVAYSTPIFWIALVLMDLLGVRLGVLPTSGYGTWKNLVLPAAVLAFYTMGPIAQLTRGSLDNELNHGYVWTARAKGVREGAVLYRHVLRNAIIPTLAYLGTQVGLIFGGAAIVETVFSWHGLGMLLVTAALTRDYPVLQGCVLVIGSAFVVINSLLEFAYELVDPRIRRTV